VKHKSREKYNSADYSIVAVDFYRRRNIFYLKVPKKDTYDFPRKFEVYFFEKKILRLFNKICGIFVSRKSEVSFFEKKIPQISLGNLRYLFWTFQIKYISLAVKNHRTLL